MTLKRELRRLEKIMDLVKKMEIEAEDDHSALIYKHVENRLQARYYHLTGNWYLHRGFTTSDKVMPLYSKPNERRELT